MAGPIIADLLCRLGVDVAPFLINLQKAANAAGLFAAKVGANLNAANARVGGSSNNMKNSMRRSTDDMKNSAGSTSEAFSVFSKETQKNFANIANITKGILISQAFYTMAGRIRGAATAMSSFMKNTENAQYAFNVLLRDADKTDRFMYVLEDFAAKTPFMFEQTANNARKLLAYGFSPDTIKPLMTTLADASAVAGDPEVFDRVAKAIGQIRTKGRLATQELLQLTEAGIPAFDILQEKLGLTAKQMQNIGKEGIGADVAIQALLAGMKERYGGASEFMAESMQGMLDTIKDNALIIGRTAFMPLFGSIERVVRKIRDATEQIKNNFRTGGLGGVLRDLVPPEIVPKIQLFAANIYNLMQVLRQLWVALLPLRSAVGELFLNVLNAILPILLFFSRILVNLISIFNSDSQNVRILVGALAGLFVTYKLARLLVMFRDVVANLFIVKALGGLIIYLAKAFAFLGVAIVRSPFVAGISILIGLLIALGIQIKPLGGWFDSLGAKISKFMGIDPGKIFQPETKKNTEDNNEFNKSLDKSKKGLEKMGKQAKKTGKEVRDGLQAFDEAFVLQDKLDEIKKDEEPGLGDLGLDDISTPSIPPVKIPKPLFPDVKKDIKNWVDTISKYLFKFLEGAGIGGIIGAVIGAAFGHPLIGAAIGAVVGGIVAEFWDKLSDRMKTTITSATIAGLIAFIIGNAIGGPGKAIIFGAIAAVVVAIVTYFWQDIQKQFTTSQQIGIGIGGLVGAILGGAFFGPFGAAFGAAIGIAVVALVEKYWTNIKNYFTSSEGIGVTIGATTGAILGGAFFGPFGVAFGAAIGAAVVALVEKYWTNIKNYFTSSRGIGATTGAVVGTILGGAFGGPFGAAFGGILFGIVGDYLGKSAGKIKQWARETRAAIGDWWAGVKQDFEDGMAAILRPFNNFFDSMKRKIDNLKNRLSNFTSSFDWGWSLPSFGGLFGHAQGGIFNKEHVARFAEGDKAEAIIPLENKRGMQPFVDAVASGLNVALEGSSMNSYASAPTSQPILYVHTLIADDQGLRELNRKMQVIQEQERAR